MERVSQPDAPPLYATDPSVSGVRAGKPPPPPLLTEIHWISGFPPPSSAKKETVEEETTTSGSSGAGATVRVTSMETFPP